MPYCHITARHTVLPTAPTLVTRTPAYDASGLDLFATPATILLDGAVASVDDDLLALAVHSGGTCTSHAARVCGTAWYGLNGLKPRFGSV